MSYKIKGETVRLYVMMGASRASDDADYTCHLLIYVKIGKFFHALHEHRAGSRSDAVGLAGVVPEFFKSLSDAQQNAINIMRDMNKRYYGEIDWHWIAKPSMLHSRDLGSLFGQNTRTFVANLKFRLINAIRPSYAASIDHLIMNRPIQHDELKSAVQKVVYAEEYQQQISTFNSTPKSVNNELFGEW